MRTRTAENCRPRVSADSAFLVPQLWSELLSLLRQYPGGLTDAVVLTSLCCNTKRHAGASASGAGTLANICRPSGEQQHSAGRTRAVIHSVRSILAQPTRPGVPPAPPTVLLGLQDGSTKHPVTLFLHSRLVHLSQGPALLVHEGAAVRCSSPPTYAAVGAAKRPDAVKLMPSVATVVEVPRDSWAALLTSCRDPSQPLPPPPPAAATMVNAASQQPAPKVPLYDLTQIVLEMVPSLGREHGIVAGWVQAMVQHVCPREHGLSGLGIGSRTLVSRRVMVCGTVEAPAALPEAVARQPRDAPAGGAGGGGAAAAPLIAVPGTTCMLALVDEAVALGDVLNPGDVIALWRPRFRVDPGTVQQNT